MVPAPPPVFAPLKTIVHTDILPSSNMLYPKEDPDSHQLKFACRTCQYSENAVSSCVFRNVLNEAIGETAGVTQDVGQDPTVGVLFNCLLCAELVCGECSRRVLGDDVGYMSDCSPWQTPLPSPTKGSPARSGLGDLGEGNITRIPIRSPTRSSMKSSPLKFNSMNRSPSPMNSGSPRTHGSPYQSSPVNSRTAMVPDSTQRRESQWRHI